MQEVKIFINGQQADLYDDVIISETHQINNFADIKTRNTTYTNIFTLPATPNNEKILKGLSFVGSNKEAGHNKLKVDVLRGDIYTVKDGYLVVHSYTKNKGYKVNIIAGIIDIFQEMGDRTIDEIINISIPITPDIQTLFNRDNEYTYSDTKNIHSININSYNIKYMAPFIYVKYIFDKIFDFYNYEYEGIIFNSDEFKQLAISLSSGFNVDKKNNTTFPIVSKTIFESIYKTSYEAKSVWIDTDFIYEFNKSGVYILNFNSDIHITDGNVAFYLQNGKERQVLDMDGSNNVFKVDATKDNPHIIKIKILCYLQKSSRLTPLGHEYVCNAQCNIGIKLTESETSVLSIRDILPKIKQKDFIKDILQHFCILLDIKPSNTKKAKYIFHRLDDIANIYNTNNILDYSSKFVELQKEIFKVGNYGQDNTFKWKDTKAIEGRELVNINGSFNSPNTIYTTEKNIIKRIYNIPMKYEWNSDILYIPLFKNEKSVKNTNTYLVQITKAKSPYTINVHNLLKEYKSIDIKLLARSINLQDNIENHYKTLMNIINHSTKILITLHLNIMDIKDIDLTKLVYIKQLGAYFIIQSIKNKGGEVSQVTLLRVPGHNLPPRVGNHDIYIKHGEVANFKISDFIHNFVDPEGDEAEDVYIINKNSTYNRLRFLGKPLGQNNKIPLENIRGLSYIAYKSVKYAYIQELYFQVTDKGSKKRSNEAKITIHVAKEIPVPQKPVAIITPKSPSVMSGQGLILSGKDSYDTDGTILSYKWRQIEGNIIKYTLIQDGQKISIDTSYPGKYKFQLTVTDNDLLTDKTDMEVYIMNSYIKVENLKRPVNTNIKKRVTFDLTGDAGAIIKLQVVSNSHCGGDHNVSITDANGMKNYDYDEDNLEVTIPRNGKIGFVLYSAINGACRMVNVRVLIQEVVKGGVFDPGMDQIIDASINS